MSGAELMYAIYSGVSPSYLNFRLDALAISERHGNGKRWAWWRRSSLVRRNRRRLHATSSRDVSFMCVALCLLFFLFFFLSPLTTTRETNSASEKRQTDSVCRVLQRRCRVSRIYRLAISIIARASMATFIRRARFPIRRRYSESALFFCLPLLPSSLGDDRWRRLSFPRSFSLNYRVPGDLLSFAFVDSADYPRE